MRRLIAGIAAALVLSGCSFTRLAYLSAGLAYSNATPMAVWYVDDYVDLTGEQRDWVRARFAAVHAWHRAEELPEYRRFLDRILAQSEDGISVDEAAAAYHDIRASYHRLLARLAPDIAEFLLRLDSAQVVQLEQRFADGNAKMVRESVRGSAEERLKRRVRGYLDHIEAWTGPLSKAQREMVASRVRDIPELFEERLAESRYRQGEMLALIRARPPRDELAASLNRLLVDVDSWRRPDYQDKLKVRERRLCEMIASLSASLTPEQRAHFRTRVRGYSSDIAELIAAT
jgi:uncharacterized protein Smg (DUF494 family)